MDVVLRAKHWQLALGFLLLVVFFSLLDLKMSKNSLDIVFSTAPYCWVLALGVRLRVRRPAYISIHYWLFQFAGAVLITFVILSKAIGITMDWHADPFSFWAIGTCILVGNGIFFSYPAKVLNSLEKGNDIDINDYFGDTFSLLCWPIGIWFLQPRINKIR